METVTRAVALRVLRAVNVLHEGHRRPVTEDSNPQLIANYLYDAGLSCWLIEWGAGPDSWAPGFTGAVEEFLRDADPNDQHAQTARIPAGLKLIPKGLSSIAIFPEGAPV